MSHKLTAVIDNKNYLILRPHEIENCFVGLVENKEEVIFKNKKDQFEKLKLKIISSTHLEEISEFGSDHSVFKIKAKFMGKLFTTKYSVYSGSSQIKYVNNLLQYNLSPGEFLEEVSSYKNFIEDWFDFKEYCSEYGENSDSIKVLEEFKKSKKYAKRLEKFMPHQIFEELNHMDVDDWVVKYS